MDTHRYRNFHLWMIIPFLIVFLGFSRSYFFDLGSRSWSQHLHGISATLWYLLLIIQPYLITRRSNIRRHKRLGLLSLLVAGMVAGTAYNIIPGNLQNVDKYTEADFFSPNFAYTATLLDLLMVTGFLVCVGLAMINARRIQEHTSWLIASAFIIIGAASTRLAVLVAFMFTDDVSFKLVAMPATLVSMVITGLFFFKFSSLKHPAFYLYLLCNFPALFVNAVGSNTWWRELANSIFL